MLHSEKEYKPSEIPRSIVARAGKVASRVAELIRDIRKMMSPYTASKLKERSYNRLKDYISVAGQLGVTHIYAFSQTSKNVIMKLGKTPEGPTMHFRINEYSLAHQIKDLQVLELTLHTRCFHFYISSRSLYLIHLFIYLFNSFLSILGLLTRLIPISYVLIEKTLRQSYGVHNISTGCIEQLWPGT